MQEPETDLLSLKQKLDLLWKFAIEVRAIVNSQASGRVGNRVSPLETRRACGFLS